MPGAAKRTDEEPPKEMTTPDAITVTGANKRYGDFNALDNVDFTVPSGSLTALLGPSGSGKSTLLRAIAGLDQPDSGTVVINGNDVTNVPTQRRGIGFVFQHYAAFKHMTVRDNVAFGLEIKGMARSYIDARVADLLAMLAGDAWSHSRPQSAGILEHMARQAGYDPAGILGGLLATPTQEREIEKPETPAAAAPAKRKRAPRKVKSESAAAPAADMNESAGDATGDS